MSDSETTISDLRQVVATFVAERDWQQFHTPKNLTMALAIEVAELMEHFQWLTPEASRAITEDSTRLQAVREELADVCCYVLAIANELDVDISQAMTDKMVKNRQKYPAEEFRGRYGLEDDGSHKT